METLLIRPSPDATPHGSSRGTPDSPPSVNNYPITRAKDVTEKQQRAIIHKKNRPETAAFPKTCVRFSGILLRLPRVLWLTARSFCSDIAEGFANHLLLR
jgi:hypothetical protein